MPGTEPADFEGDVRPCGSVDPRGISCEEGLLSGPGIHRCRAGHTTVGFDLSSADGHLDALRPVVVARWIAYDASDGQTFRYVIQRRGGSSTATLRQLAKDDARVKYGAEPIGDRKVVLTHHAVAEMNDEAISRTDVLGILSSGTIFQRQPWGKVRLRGADSQGRTIHVVYRLSTLHEVVVVTAFLEDPARTSVAV
jgi:hypothetical protein